MKHLLVSLLTMLLIMTSAWAADPRSNFEQGLDLYRNGDMTAAIQVWETIVGQGRASGELYYNLGNAYYRSGDVGRAILYFTRAKQLLPRDPDVRTNLDLAKMAAVDKIERPVRLFVWDWVDRVRDFLSLPELARLFHILGFVTLAVWAVWLFGSPSLRGKLRSLGVILLVVYGLSGAWYVWRSSLAAHPKAVIMATKTDVYSAPDTASTQLFALHEGTAVGLGERLSGWVNIRLEDGRQGWIPAGDVERI